MVLFFFNPNMIGRKVFFVEAFTTMNADDTMNSGEAGLTHNNAATTDSIIKQQRQLKADQQRFQRKAQEQLQKQNQLITDLSKSNAQLREELTKADTSTFNAKEQDRLSKVQAEVDQLEMKIQYERMRQDDVKSKHNMSRVEIMSTRRNMGGVNITTENTQAVEKQMKVLENRLDQALVKFNEALAHNKNLRAEIDSLREERQVFQRIYKRLELELHEKKKSMAEKIERANLDYEERDHLKQEIEARRIAAEEDKKMCQDSFLQLDKVLEQLKQTSQEQKRQQLQALTLKQQQQSNNKDSSSSPLASSDPFNTTRGGNNNNNSSSRGGGGHNRTGGANRTIMSREGDSRGGEGVMDEEERDLQQVVDDLKAMTGHQDLRLLLENFQKSEELNFSMYHFLNSLATQQEDLEKEIADLKAQLQSEQGNADRRSVLKKLENELAACEMQQDRLTSDTARQLQGLAQVRELTSDLFILSGADREAAIKELGTDEPTDLKLRDFLGILEQRVNELLFLFSRGAAASAHAAQFAPKDDLADDTSDNGALENSERQDATHHGQKSAAFAAASSSSTKFIGVGPSSEPTAVTAKKVIKTVALPSTNAGDGGDAAEDAAAAGKEEILSHDEMRQRVEQRMQRRIEREEKQNNKGNRGKKSVATVKR